MLPITPEQFELLLPLACQWAAEQEERILTNGDPLSATQFEDARLIPVLHPERVRLLYVPAIPIPEHPTLRAAAQATQLITPSTGGLTLRYGIFIRSDCRGDRALVVHELGHTAQYECLGDLRFLTHSFTREVRHFSHADLATSIEYHAMRQTKPAIRTMFFDHDDAC